VSRLFLSCGFCGRKQADGLISRGSWGHLEVHEGHVLRACPTCKEHYTDWESRLLLVANGQSHGVTDSPRFGATHR
jgi:hypothetical protein